MSLDTEPVPDTVPDSPQARRPPQPQGRIGRPAVRTKDEKAALGLQIANLRMQGLSFEQIGQQLTPPLSKSAVFRLYQDYSAEFIKENIRDAKALLTTYKNRMDFGWRQHYAAYYKTVPKDAEGKPIAGAHGDLRVLRAGLTLYKDEVDLLQSAGFIPKKNIGIDLNADDTIKEFMNKFWKPEEKKKEV